MGNLVFVQVSFSLNITDAQPTARELRMLVATKVDDYHGLGCMLDLDFTRIEMFEKERKGDAVLINMKILTVWLKEETRMPTTWLTLIGALRDMDMMSLAHDLTEKLEA